MTSHFVLPIPMKKKLKTLLLLQMDALKVLLTCSYIILNFIGKETTFWLIDVVNV